MDFRDLTYLLAIARQQNITRAAESLYLSQPTLSKFLKGLEGELGLPLFERLGNKYIPTYAGEQYIKKSQGNPGPQKRTRSADGRYHKKQ